MASALQSSTWPPVAGLRAAEITGLELESVDFLRREINISQRLVCVTGASNLEPAYFSGS